METIRQIIKQVKVVLEHMTTPQKVSLFLVSISMFICLFVVFFWSTKPDYVVLFSKLSMTDAAAIQTELQGLDIPHKIVGTTIKVPAKYVYETRLTLANEGLPKAPGVGFEIFDKIRVGQTDYMQRLNYQRALEGELSRTIDSLKPIEFSRVHLVMPEDTIFTEQKKETTASIVLNLRSGGTLDKDSVIAIKHLAATSVEGLDIDNITIIDSQGNLLSSASDGSDLVSGMTANQIETQRGIEKYLEQKAASLLLGFLGPDKAIVRVSVEMDFSQTEKTEESFKPEQQIARSENRIEEVMKDPAGNGDNTIEKTVTNYEIGRTVEHMVGATGSLERVSVAVVLDGIYKISDDGDRTYVERSPDEIESIKQLIINALGISTNRGDQIEVRNIAFDKSFLEERRAEAKKADRMNLIYNILGQWPWLFVLILFVFMYRIFKNVLSTAAEMKVALPKFMVEGKGNIPGVMSEKEAQEEEAKMKGGGLEIPAVSKLEKEVVQLAAQHPDTIARIVRSWMEGENV